MTLQVEAAEKEAQSKCDAYMTELSYQTRECEKMKETNALLSNELKEKVCCYRQVTLYNLFMLKDSAI